MSSTLRMTGLVLVGAAAATYSLTACSSSPAAVPVSPATPATPATSASAVTPKTPVTPKTLITGETSKTETSSSSRTSGGGGQVNSGFDGPAFQSAMSAVDVRPTSTTAKSKSTGAGTLSYTLTGGAQGIGRIDCFVKAQGSNDSQSDQAALSLSNPFLESCGAYSQYGDLKSQAAQYVQTTLPKVQGESMQTTTVGAIQLKVGRDGPGSYFVTIINGG